MLLILCLRLHGRLQSTKILLVSIFLLFLTLKKKRKKKRKKQTSLSSKIFSNVTMFSSSFCSALERMSAKDHLQLWAVTSKLFQVSWIFIGLERVLSYIKLLHCIFSARYSPCQTAEQQSSRCTVPLLPFSRCQGVHEVSSCATSFVLDSALSFFAIKVCFNLTF